MIFSTLSFGIFFAVVIGLLIGLPNQTAKKVVLFLASCYFYAYWDYRFLFLILFATGFNFILGQKIGSAEQRNKKILLWTGLVINLGVLGFFKYYNFFVQSIKAVFGGWGFDLVTLNIILPVGISFFTFELISYLVDIYKGKLKASDNILEFAIFVTFFPRLASGPIIRPADFIPQIQRGIFIRKENVLIGLQMFAFGMVKKVLLADRVAYFVNYVFEAPNLYSSGTVWLALVGYTIQIYCDFSGYSDMSMGIAKCMGIDLPLNFNMPYVTTNIGEFWRRWHISLSSWLRDYLYIPLGGNRKGNVRTYINLMLTMLLGGLWHGASWNFVLWGGLHGLGLAIDRWLSKRFQPVKNAWNLLLGWSTTLVFVMFCWVFFRMPEFTGALQVFEKLFFINSAGIHWTYLPMLLVIPVVVLAHIYGTAKKLEKHMVFDLRTFSGAFLLVITVMCLFYLAPTNSNPFIYFQF